MRRKIKSIGKAITTSFRKHNTSSDYARWGKDQQALSEKWDSRTAQIGSLIPPDTSVIEFGAGRMVLKNHLPASCRYTPSDIADRGEGTLICDLNGDSLIDFPAHDVAAFSGVLEYINDVPRLITHLSGAVNTIVSSYAITELNPKTFKRRGKGWVNDYDEAGFKAVFAANGFDCDHSEQWGSQMIYRFHKK